MKKINKTKKTRKVSVLNKLEAGILKSASELRKELPASVKIEQLDRYIEKLADAGKIWLHRHAFPAMAKRNEVFKINGETYCGLTLRD